MADSRASSDPYEVVRDKARLLALADAPRTIQDHIVQAAERVLRIYAEKDPDYAGSWARRGTDGIFHNVARKFDRIEAAVTRGRPPRADDCLDLATYALLQLAYHTRADARPAGAGASGAVAPAGGAAAGGDRSA